MASKNRLTWGISEVYEFGLGKLLGASWGLLGIKIYFESILNGFEMDFGWIFVWFLIDSSRLFNMMLP
eukprot:5494686-Karenia_brevis.AAC.1